MGLFKSSTVDQINAIAAKSKDLVPQTKPVSTSVTDTLNEISQRVLNYFPDSPARPVSSIDELHEYIDHCIEVGYAGIDTETTGLDRIRDYVVGWSIYAPGKDEIYIPCKHRMPIFETLYTNQLTYEQCKPELQRLVDAKVRMIFANADFDIAMIYKDLGVDFCDTCYYDVILAWRCLKENEKDNSLKGLYAKYPKKGKVDPMKFSDFFPPSLFPYCKPEIAALYAANDAKITYELFVWQLPYVTKGSELCTKHHLEKIADLVWNIEFPMIKVCAMLHRRGMFLDDTIVAPLHVRYQKKLDATRTELANAVQQLIDERDTAVNRKRPFRTGSDFNSNSNPHVLYLLKNLLGLDVSSTGKEVLNEVSHPVAKIILDERKMVKLLGTYIDKMPGVVGSDNRVHCSFKSIGAACVTGDTIVPTSDGYVTIGELCESNGCVEGQLIEVPGITIFNKDQNPEVATHVVKYTDVPTVKVELEYGITIEGTPNHPIMVSKYLASDEIYANSKLLNSFWDDRHFKNLEALNVGDWVELPCNYSCNPSTYVPTGLVLHPPYQTSRTVATMPEFYDEDFAEFLGMYHADGHAAFSAGTYTITFSNQHADVIRRIEELGLKLFNVPASHYTAQAAKHEIDTYLSCMQIKDIDRILSHGKRNKRIPSAIWKSPKTVINSYIKGLTLDSSVYLEYGRAAFALSVFDVIDATMIQMHLASQGILCYMCWNENKGGLKSPNLTFNPDNYMRFRDTIGFVESRKYVETEGCIRNLYRSRRIGDSFRLKVKKITASRNTVYDLHVPGSHSFISNGVISHNTGRMCLAKGTMVSILDGHKPIEYIEPGDVVYCLDENDMPVVRKVLNKWRTGRNQKCVLVNFNDTRYRTSRHLICTPEHRIMLNSGEWVEAINLQPGQELKVLNTFVPTIKHVSATVLSVVMMPDFKLYDVYDIEVDDPGHHFAANGIIVHNSSESPNLQNIPSKLHDIRHMFRATPEITELMEVDDDNMIVLSDIDRIEVKGKGLTYVKDLVVGDIVIMSDGQETCEFKIADLEFIEESACYKIGLEQLFS